MWLNDQRQPPCPSEALLSGVCHGLPVCGFCYDFGQFQKPSWEYSLFNLIVIGLILPSVGIFGLAGNALSAFVYSRPNMSSSLNLYLCALAASDTVVISTSFSLFFLESMRRRSALCQKYFALLAPVMFPVGLSAQSSSVFLTVAAAFDCFVLVIGSDGIKERFRRTITARWVIVIVVVAALLFNLPHLFEISVVYCWSVQYSIASYDVCPTALRQNEAYLTLYYAYLYTIVMAAGPVLLLVVINTAIVLAARHTHYVTRRVSRSSAAAAAVIDMSVDESSTRRDDGGDEATDITMLVLVVCIFIACNILPLTVNFLELLFNIVNSYLIDLSNLMVVLNSSCNFIIYCAFGQKFRTTLKAYMHQWCSSHDALGTEQALLNPGKTTTTANNRDVKSTSNYLECNGLDMRSVYNKKRRRSSI